MAEPITVTIGGEVIALPPIMNFATLERVWPAIKAAEATSDPIEQTAARVAIVSAALLATRPDLTVPAIKALLRVNLVDGTDETVSLAQSIQEMLLQSGLIRTGEVKPPETPAADATTST
nr:hypothetical protein [uncultured Rhodopila sp.]